MIGRICLAALALAGCTASGKMEQDATTRADRELADALKGRVAGKPVDCISTNGINGPQIIDGNTILYRESGRTVWRNELPASCPGMRSGDTLVVEIHGTQLCKFDQVSALTPGTYIPGPKCSLGQFTPYRK